jgi:hypothetical protein
VQQRDGGAARLSGQSRRKIRVQFTNAEDIMHNAYSARKAITLIVKAANAGGAHMILVVLSVSLLLSALVKFVTSI